MIVLPYDYPNNLDRLWYTEQYVLYELLSPSSRGYWFEVV